MCIAFDMGVTESLRSGPMGGRSFIACLSLLWIALGSSENRSEQAEQWFNSPVLASVKRDMYKEIHI